MPQGGAPGAWGDAAAGTSFAAKHSSKSPMLPIVGNTLTMYDGNDYADFAGYSGFNGFCSDRSRDSVAAVSRPKDSRILRYRAKAVSKCGCW